MATLPALSPLALRGTKSPSEVIALYTDVRTLRRLTNEENASLFNAFVQAGRVNDAAGMRGLLPAGRAGQSGRCGITGQGSGAGEQRADDVGGRQRHR